MNEQTMRFRIGVFVLAALLLLAVLITLFGSAPTLFKRYNHYTVKFTDAPGVDTGTPVRRSGIRIGEVETVVLDNETGLVRVRIMIEPKYTIRRNEQPTLVVGLLGGDTTIDFIPRPQQQEPRDRQPVEEGEELVGLQAANVTSVLAQAAEIVPTTQEALNAIRKSLERVEKMLPNTERAIGEYEQLAKDARETNKEIQGLVKEVRTFVPELRQTNRAVQDLAKSTNDIVPELKRTNDEIQITARNFGKLGERIDTIVQTNQKEVLDRFYKTADNLNKTLEQMGEVFSPQNTQNFKNIMQNVSDGSKRLESLTKNTDQLLVDSQKVMKHVGDSVQKADEVLANLKQATKPMADRSEVVMKNLDESTAKLNRTLTDVRELLRAVSQSEGTLSKFLTDPALYNRLDEAACIVTKILPRVDRALKDFETFADKLARHPESIGIGGVVRPSSGVK